MEKEIQCSSCSKIIKVKIYNAGLGGIIPFTCDRDSTVLVVPTWDKRLYSVLGEHPKSAWSENHFRTVEAQLRPCPFGGRFTHDALPKCPNCGAILKVGLGRSEFVVVGEMINGEKENPWNQ